MAFADLQTGAIIFSAQDVCRILLAGTVSKGDALGWSSGYKRALATAGGVIQIRAVALEDGVTDQYILAAFGSALIGGARFTGATANGAVYVAESTLAGQYTQTAPSTAGDATTSVGVALSASTLLINPAHAEDSHA
jgi:hypothetical protein